MGAKTLEALKECGAVYLNAIGGAAQFYARCIERVDGVSLLEFGVPEAMWHIAGEGLPGHRHDGRAREQPAQGRRGREREGTRRAEGLRPAIGRIHGRVLRRGEPPRLRRRSLLRDRLPLAPRHRPGRDGGARRAGVPPQHPRHLERAVPHEVRGRPPEVRRRHRASASSATTRTSRCSSPRTTARTPSSRSAGSRTSEDLARQALRKGTVHYSELKGNTFNPTEVVATLINEAGQPRRRAVVACRRASRAPARSCSSRATASTPRGTASAAPRSRSAGRTAPGP